MRRAKTLLNLPIISLSDGRVVGHIRDVIFDPQSARIAGFLVREAGWLLDALVVPSDRVRSLGRDAVTVPDKLPFRPGFGSGPFADS